jgi:hypothetical protein
LPSRCLATIGGIQTHTQTETWSHKPTLIFQNKESRLKKNALCGRHVWLFVWPSFCDLISASTPLERFPWNLIWETFTESYRALPVYKRSEKDFSM